MKSPIHSKINTIFIHVSDLTRSVKWYSQLLGHEYNLNDVTDPVYNLQIDHYTGLTLDAGPAGVLKENNPSPYPLFNFHTEDIKYAYEYINELGFQIKDDMIHFNDFSFFTISDPDHNIIMICTG